MIKVLTSIVTLFNTLVTFFINTFKSIFMLISKIPDYTTFLSTAIASLPLVIIPFMAASISVYVVLFILGRNK